MFRLDEILAAKGHPAPVRHRAVIDFNLAFMSFGKWVDKRREETILVDAPQPKKGQTPKKAVPKYKSLAEILGLDDPRNPTQHATSHKPGRKTAVEAQAEELLRDPEAMSRFMQELVS